MGLLTKTMSVLAENDYRLQEDILELNGEIASIAQITSEELDKVYSKLNQTNHKIHQLAKTIKADMHSVI